MYIYIANITFTIQTKVRTFVYLIPIKLVVLKSVSYQSGYRDQVLVISTISS